MAKKRAKLSNEQKLQVQVKKLTHEKEMLEGSNTRLKEQVDRAEIRANDHRQAMQQKDDYQRVLNDKIVALTAERDRVMRLVDQFTSVQIVSPADTTRALRHPKTTF